MNKRAMTRRTMNAKPDPTKLLLLAALGVVGLIVARRYGLVNGLRAVNRALGLALVARGGRPARRVRPKVLRFSKPA